MEYIIYKVKGYTSMYNPETEEVEQKEILVGVKTPYTEDALQKAVTEAYNGEYTIEDDGYEEPGAKPSEEERISELEEALALLLSGVTE